MIKVLGIYNEFRTKKNTNNIIQITQEFISLKKQSHPEKTERTACDLEPNLQILWSKL